MRNAEVVRLGGCQLSLPAALEPSAIANLMTKDGARKIAAGIAKPRELLTRWKDAVAAIALSEPHIAWFETAVIVDNESHQVKVSD